MLPDNIVYRFEGDRSDVVVVKDKLGLAYHVAYQFSKRNGQWRFHLDRSYQRYESIDRTKAMRVARRVYNNMNAGA